ncbi:MAG: class F sortase [Dehalococcoidia bacterium]|nr:class F sortase [Dehalococcoidia bacterium]
MSRLLSKVDRRTALGGLTALASAGLLALGLFTVVSALTDDDIPLPSEGSLQQIIGADAPAAGEPQAPPPTPAGPPPVRLVIARLYIDAPIITLGLDARRYPEVPARPDQVAWYNFSAVPGQSSNAVFAGHVDWQTRAGDPIPGVFYRLRELEIGDSIAVTLEDGAQVQYRVTGNVATAYNDPNVVKAMDTTTRDVITLITCGGAWVPDPSEASGGNYSHRVIVRAERVAGFAGG